MSSSGVVRRLARLSKNDGAIYSRKFGIDLGIELV
jgi:hypothetical protein